MTPKAYKVMILRHGEKPAGKVAGVDEAGESSAHDLSVRGWQRAGALACLLAPAHGPLQNELLVKPAFIFASAAAADLVAGESKSRRSEQTVTPLGQLLGIAIDLRFSKGQEKAVAKAAQECTGPVLIAWQHENISAIANFILGADKAPKHWPGSRFDLIFVCTLNPGHGTYSFTQVPQCLLAGDSADPI